MDCDACMGKKKIKQLERLPSFMLEVQAADSNGLNSFIVLFLHHLNLPQTILEVTELENSVY